MEFGFARVDGQVSLFLNCFAISLVESSSGAALLACLESLAPLQLPSQNIGKILTDSMVQAHSVKIAIENQEKFHGIIKVEFAPDPCDPYAEIH